MVRYSHWFNEDFIVCDLAKKAKYSDIPVDRFFDWLENNRNHKYIFVNEDKGNINAFMILLRRLIDGEQQLLMHSIYTPPESNGLSDKFYKNV